MALCFYIIKCLLPHLSAAKAESHEPPHCLPNQILTDELAGEMAQQHLLVRNHNLQTPLQQCYVQWTAEPYGEGHAVGRGVRIQLVQQDHDLLAECAVHSASLPWGSRPGSRFLFDYSKLDKAFKHCTMLCTPDTYCI